MRHFLHSFNFLCNIRYALVAFNCSESFLFCNSFCLYSFIIEFDHPLKFSYLGPGKCNYPFVYVFLDLLFVVVYSRLVRSYSFDGEAFCCPGEFYILCYGLHTFVPFFFILRSFFIFLSFWLSRALSISSLFHTNQINSMGTFNCYDSLIRVTIVHQGCFRNPFYCLKHENLKSVVRHFLYERAYICKVQLILSTCPPSSDGRALAF